MQEKFYLSQILLGGLFVLGTWYWLQGRAPKSGFRVREADLRNGQSPSASHSQKKDPLAEAKIQRTKTHLLGGISISDPPHVLLGVSLQASEEEISKAYREKMKHYHPDRIGRPGTREWQDAQQIAEALNRAKAELLKRARERKD